MLNLASQQFYHLDLNLILSILFHLYQEVHHGWCY
uniref:Uncharacterized protein n=1 Tax=Arundo donax TaxID=35708 RepID=A0A0A9CLH7_ARUDO